MAAPIEGKPGKFFEIDYHAFNQRRVKKCNTNVEKAVDKEAAASRKSLRESHSQEKSIARSARSSKPSGCFMNENINKVLKGVTSLVELEGLARKASENISCWDAVMYISRDIKEEYLYMLYKRNG